ncbi:MAG: hypothetical protein APF76_18235 [Desulfitibacter sp. BRH_c19]|nr:MAG: hypothetical protein APF76_18235 [Desulfitibacter sp. BRH_c19]
MIKKIKLILSISALAFILLNMFYLLVVNRAEIIITLLNKFNVPPFPKLLITTIIILIVVYGVGKLLIYIYMVRLEMLREKYQEDINK